MKNLLKLTGLSLVLILLALGCAPVGKEVQEPIEATQLDNTTINYQYLDKEGNKKEISYPGLEKDFPALVDYLKAKGVDGRDFEQVFADWIVSEKIP